MACNLFFIFCSVRLSRQYIDYDFYLNFKIIYYFTFMKLVQELKCSHLKRFLNEHWPCFFLWRSFKHSTSLNIKNPIIPATLRTFRQITIANPITSLLSSLVMFWACSTWSITRTGCSSESDIVKDGTGIQLSATLIVCFFANHFSNNEKVWYNTNWI